MTTHCQATRESGFTPCKSLIASACMLAFGGTWLPLELHAQSTEPAPQGAASAPSAQLEAVTVTARKRSEKLLDVPISAQAFTSKELKAQGAYDLQDIKTQAGFTFVQTSGTAAGGRAFGVLNFRGLAGDGGQFFENSGALFIDGIFVSGGVSTVNTVDVSRVEVLKGPQNAFFGRSTFGGAINLVTRIPASKLQGEVNTKVNNRGSVDADGTIEGPILPDMLNGRITVVSHHRAAIARASDGGDLGEENTKSVTGTLYFTPTDELWMRLRGHYQKDEDSSAAIGIVRFNGNTSCSGRFYAGTNNAGASQPFTPANAYACDSVPQQGSPAAIVDANTNIPAAVRAAYVDNSLGDSFLSKSPRLDHTGMARESTRVSLQGGYSLPNAMDLALNIGHNSVNTVAIWDLDRSPTPNFINVQPINTRDTTIDMRLTTNPAVALRGLLGASYFTSVYQLSQIDYNVPFGATAATINTGNYNNYKSTVPAIYGSIEYDLTKELTLSGDVRYQTDKIVSTSRAGVSYENEKSNVLPRVILRWTPVPNSTVYASASEGVQPLTTNSGYTGASADGKAYISSVVPGSSDFSPQPKLRSFELGFKQRLMNDKLQYTIAAYDQRWSNRLTNSFVFNPGTCTPAQALTPACPLPASGTFVVFGNEARIRGLELAVDAAVSSQWQIGGTVDYKRARWASYRNSSVSALTGGTPATTTSGFDGNTLGKVPALTASLNSTYRMPLSATWMGYVRGDVAYVGKAWDTDFNIVETDAFTRANLRFGVEKSDITIEAFVTNLFDDRHWDSTVRSSDLTFTPLNNFNRQAFLTGVPEPRAYGVRVSYKF